MTERCALYVGAGVDTRPLRCLPCVRRFVYVDGQPESEFPEVSTEEPGYARPRFVSSLDREMAFAGFHLKQAACDIRVYTSPDDRVVEYHINTGVPSRVERLPMGVCDTLILAGHDPHSAAMERCCRADVRLDFVGHHGTVYSQGEDHEPDSVLNRLHGDAAFRARFARFLFFDKAEHVDAQARWEDFVRRSSSSQPFRHMYH